MTVQKEDEVLCKTRSLCSWLTSSPLLASPLSQRRVEGRRPGDQACDVGHAADVRWAWLHARQQEEVNLVVGEGVEWGGEVGEGGATRSTGGGLARSPWPWLLFLFIY